MHLSRIRLFGVLVGALSLSAMAALTAPALAALPPGYQVQRVDSPLKTTNGGFGNLATPVGDVNGDGKEDWIAIQTAGSLNNDGIFWTIDGVTGQVIRSVNAADGGGNGGRAGADGNIFRMTDIGRCTNAPAQVAGQPGPTCQDATIGPPDGVNEILIGSGGVDVGGVTDAGRVYVLDGRTLVVLKRIDMPAADLADITTAVNLAENAPIATGSTVPAIRGGFGRTATTPRGLPPCNGNAGIGTCPAMPIGVRNGDIDGGGVSDVIVGATAFPDTAATAHPLSHCKANAGTGNFPQTCRAAGRTFVYRGELIAGSDPAVPLNTTLYTLKSISSQADDPFNPAGRQENFGHSQMPIGDVGGCTIAIPAGDRCPPASSVITPDGKPDFVVSAHRSDVPIFNPDPQYFETGVSYLFDGATGSLLYTYNDPEPVANALFGFTTGQNFAVGNLGDSALPDVILAGFQTVSNKVQSGRGYEFRAIFKANFIKFAIIDDPTPNTFGRFGNPTEGIGEIVGGEQVGNEVLVGQFSAVQTPLKDDVDFDVNFMNPANNQGLQTIADPDAQPESGFGSELMPLGDLNNDNFLDFAVSSVRWDAPATPGPAVVDQGRVYVFKSDANAVVPPPPPPPGPGPAGPAGPAGTPGAPGAPGAPGSSSAAAVLAGRTVDLDASKSTIRRNASIQLRGVVEAFANPAGCEAGQTVQLQRRGVSGSRFTTFRSARTNSRGSFSTPRFRVSSTTLYRARVLQTAGCEGAQSTREKVTVTRRGR